VSSAVTLFDLGSELARAHERSSQGSVTVIPVLVDDLGRARPILHALCHATEGRLFEATDPELGAAVPKTGDIVRRRAVETALVDARS
jgi:hypothetical protein